MITVSVIKKKGRFYQLRWTDPVTGRRHERSSKVTRRADAMKAAGILQTQLNSGEASASGDGVTAWQEFRQAFEIDYMSPLSKNYKKNVSSTLNVVERVMKPDKVGRITTVWLNQFRTKALKRKPKPSDATIHKYFQHLETLLRFAVDQDYISTLPKMPKQRKKAGKSRKLAKGRPITAEEFDRMVAKSPSESLTHLMTGLWLSGLRIGEALALTWDRWEDGIRVEFDGDDVFLMIDGDQHKGGEPVLYPVVDEFADFLRQTPPEEREGHVFNPIRQRQSVCRRIDTVSKWIVAIGKDAAVKTDQVDGNPVYASAHDLRRSFGDRWARRGVPVFLLKELMRHASVTTTEQFYAVANARRTTSDVRKYTETTQ